MANHTESKHLVKVITPLYTPSLTDREQAALLNNMRVLSNYTGTTCA